MKVNPVIVFREEFDGSSVLFDPDSGEAFELGEVATFIWKGLAKGQDKEVILTKLSEICPDMPECAADDFDQFCAQLTQKGMLKA